MPVFNQNPKAQSQSLFAMAGLSSVAAGVAIAATMIFMEPSASTNASVQSKATINDVIDDRAVEFTASSQDITSLIERACTQTGCQMDQIHPLIITYAEAMDNEQLDAALWAQVRLVQHSEERLKAALPGSEAAELAFRELSAAANIAALYTNKLSMRR